MNTIPRARRAILAAMVSISDPVVTGRMKAETYRAAHDQLWDAYLWAGGSLDRLADESEAVRRDLVALHHPGISAAATEMLSVLVAFVGECDASIVDPEEMSPPWVALYKDAKAAIAKAGEGGGS